ncbi:hypothetical protein Droror1_Dr00009244 [Drosera rotundifolia]
MEATPRLLLLSFLLLISLHQALPATALSPASDDFIRSCCNATLNPDLCYASLARFASSAHSDPAQLARFAIGLSLSQARYVASFLSTLARNSHYSMDPSSASALRDCVSVFRDTAGLIKDSLVQMRELGRGYGEGYEVWRFQISNVKTWMSAAITNEDTCVDGFDEVGDDGKVKADVERRVGVATEFASIALAIVDWYAALLM